MSKVNKLEKEILSLSPAEREQLALAGWESLASYPEEAELLPDPEGISLAQQRDNEIQSGSVAPLSRSEFLRRTNSHAAE